MPLCVGWGSLSRLILGIQLVASVDACEADGVGRVVVVILSYAFDKGIVVG